MVILFNLSFFASQESRVQDSKGAMLPNSFQKNNKTLVVYVAAVNTK